MLDRKGGRPSRSSRARTARLGPRVLLAVMVGVLAVALGLLGAMGAFASGGAPGAVAEHNVEITKHEAVLQGTVSPTAPPPNARSNMGRRKAR